MIGIYYIATKDYALFANSFINSLQNFWPSQKKHLRLIGDKSMEKYVCNTDNLVIDFVEINHYPWPVITLYKFYLMKEYKIENVEYHFYFNSNVVFKQMPFGWNAFKNDITVCQHALSSENVLTDYIQGGAICLSDKIFNTFCDEHIKRTNKYLQEDFKIPQWHDETILNEMLIRDKVFNFKWFPIEYGLRWLYTNHSKKPNIGLCYLNNNEIKQKLQKEKNIN